MKAVVLAAGKGTRLDPLTHSAAKPMMPIANRPIMQHIIERLHGEGFREIFANLYYRPDDIISYFGNGSAWNVSITWRTEAQLTGSAGGIMAFADLLEGEESILVVSGDALHDIDLRALMDFHASRAALLSVAMKRVLNPGRYGVGSIDKDKHIVRFEEKPLIDSFKEGLVSCGIYCLSSPLLKRIPRGMVYDFGADLIPELAGRNEEVFCFEVESYWRDIGNLTELRLANLDAAAGRVQLHIPGEKKKDGVYIEYGAVIGPDVEVVPPVLIGEYSRIERDTRLVGPIVVGPHVTVGKGSYISRSVLLQRSHIPPRAIIVDGLVGTLTTNQPI
jgi:NDP-sugar pyrophosphorylase family protein